MKAHISGKLDSGEFIVKVQRPMFTTGAPMCLVYNKTRSIRQQIPLNRAILKVMEDDYKIFCRARLEGGKIILGDRVPSQNW